MVHNQLRAVITIASLYLLSLVTLSVRDLRGVNVKDLWSAADWLEFLGLCGLYVVTGMLGLMTAYTLSLRATRWFGTAWWCCTALSAASTLGFVALLFRQDQEAAAKELYDAVHQYDIKFSGVGGSAARTAAVAAVSSVSTTKASTTSVSRRRSEGGSGYRGRGYSACHDGILYGDRSLFTDVDASTPPAGWFVGFVSEAILDSVVQVVFMTLVCLATARLQAYLEEWLEATHAQDSLQQDEGKNLADLEAAVPLVSQEHVAVMDDEKKKQSF